MQGCQLCWALKKSDSPAHWSPVLEYCWSRAGWSSGPHLHHLAALQTGALPLQTAVYLQLSPLSVKTTTKTLQYANSDTSLLH